MTYCEDRMKSLFGASPSAWSSCRQWSRRGPPPGYAVAPDDAVAERADAVEGRHDVEVLIGKRPRHVGVPAVEDEFRHLPAGHVGLDEVATWCALDYAAPLRINEQRHLGVPKFF
jgi:hypothetical protein